MTVDEIFNAIKDYEDLDIWVDDGDKMMSSDGTLETAQWMLDNIEAGARVEARIYYDEDGNRVPSDEYNSDVDVETIFDSDDFIVDEYNKNDDVGDTSEMINFPNIGRKLDKNNWVESRLCKAFCERFNIKCHIKDYDLYDKISSDCETSDKNISIFNDALHIEGDAVRKYLKNDKYSRVTVSIRDGECELFLRPDGRCIDLGLRWTLKTDLSSFLPKLVQKVVDVVKTL